MIIEDEISRLRGELEEARRERDDWRGSYELVRSKHAEASPALARAEVALTVAVARAEKTEAERDAAVAEVARLRESLTAAATVVRNGVVAVRAMAGVESDTGKRRALLMFAAGLSLAADTLAEQGAAPPDPTPPAPKGEG